MLGLLWSIKFQLPLLDLVIVAVGDVVFVFVVVVALLVVTDHIIFSCGY